MGGMIEFARPDGGRTKGYLATAGQGRPGIVVIQEWWGLNDQICGVADRFARAGYNALAPDLYKGRVTATPDEANHLMTGLDFADATNQDLRGAAGHLKSSSGRVAVMGFCMGGALTIAALVHIPDLAAGVCFYGIPPKEFADPARIVAPFQGILRTGTTGAPRMPSTRWKRRCRRRAGHPKSTATTRRTRFSTSAARPTMSPAPTRPGSAWQGFSNGIYRTTSGR